MTANRAHHDELRLANERLAEENRQLRARLADFETCEREMAILLAGVDLASVFIDRERRIHRFSPGATRLFAIGDGDIGRPFEEIARHFDDPGLDADIMQVLGGGAPPECEVLSDEGRWYMRRVLRVEAHDDADGGVVVSLIDIDAIKASEELVQESLQQRIENRSHKLREQVERRVELERQLRAERDFVGTVLDSTHALIIVTDEQGRVVRFNRACEQASGLRADQVIGREVFDLGLIPGSEQDGVRDALHQVLEGGGLTPHENRWVHRDGSVRDFEWVNVPLRSESGELTYVVASGIDVTRRKRQAEELRDERDLSNLILDTVPSMVRVNDPQGRVVRFNRAVQRLTGLSFEEVVGKDTIELLVPEGEREPWLAQRRKLLSGQTIEDEFVTIKVPSGETKTILMCGAPLLNADGNVKYLITAGLDITPLVQAQAREQERLAEVAQLHRAHTAGELAAVLAHEINQPLAAITSYASAGLLTAGSDGGTDRSTELFEKIANAAVRAGRVVRDLRAFVSRSPSTVGPMDLDAALQASFELVESYAARQAVKLEVQPGDSLSVVADPIQVQHIMVNLLRNGIEAIAGSGQAEGKVTVSTAVDGDMGRITIVDTGPGITQDELSNLYQPFFSSKAEGLGMGFRISRTLASANGGRILTELHAPGAVFHVLLPLAK